MLLVIVIPLVLAAFVAGAGLACILQIRRDHIEAFAAAADKLNRQPPHPVPPKQLRVIPLQVDRKHAADDPDPHAW
jgi:hypothetical protein